MTEPDRSKPQTSEAGPRCNCPEPRQGSVLQFAPSTGTVQLTRYDSGDVTTVPIIGYAVVVADVFDGNVYSRVEPVVIIDGHTHVAGNPRFWWDNGELGLDPEPAMWEILTDTDPGPTP